MRKAFLILTILLLALNLSATSLSFSGGKSSLSLREGKEEVTLSEGATVTLDDMTIIGDRIVLSGKDWQYIKCEGSTSIKDTARGLDIRATDILYDRVNETISIESWFEINDTKEEITAMGGTMYFDMNEESLEMVQQVVLLKITDKGIMECSSESMLYKREEKSLSLISGATVKWNGDEYKAEVISVNLDDDSINLEGRIKGTING